MTSGARALRPLYERLRTAWSTETGRHWRPGNPAAGQCGVTALVVHDLLGGEVLKTDIDGAAHFYNRIDGRRVDFTMGQFDAPILYDDLPATRAEAMADCTPAQYAALRRRLGLPATPDDGEGAAR